MGDAPPQSAYARFGCWPCAHDGREVEIGITPRSLDVLPGPSYALDETALSFLPGDGWERFQIQRWRGQPEEGAEFVFDPETVVAFKRRLLLAGATLMDLHVSWRVTRFLSSGGFAEVFAIERIDVDGKPPPHLPVVKEAALKVFKNGLHGPEADKTWRAFRHEVKVLRRAQGHPNILPLYGAYHNRTRQQTPEGAQVQVRPALAVQRMRELLWNGALRIHPAPGDPPRVEERAAMRYLSDLLSALSFLHGRRVVHRDIKLDNLMLNFDDQLVLCDFGLATQADPAKKGQKADCCGTVGYLAPEVIRAARTQERVEVDVFKADVFAVGVVAFKLLSGRSTFAGGNLKEVFRNNLYFNISLEHLEPLPELAQQAVLQLLAELHDRPTARNALLHPWYKEEDAKLDDVGYPSLPEVSLPEGDVPPLSSLLGSARAPSFLKSRLPSIIRKWHSGSLSTPRGSRDGSAAPSRTASMSPQTRTDSLGTSQATPRSSKQRDTPPDPQLGELERHFRAMPTPVRRRGDDGPEPEAKEDPTPRPPPAPEGGKRFFGRRR